MTQYTGIGTIFEIVSGPNISGAGSDGTSLYGINGGLLVHSVEFTWGSHPTSCSLIIVGDTISFDTNGNGSYAGETPLAISAIERFHGSIDFETGSSFQTDDTSAGNAFSIITTSDGRQFLNMPSPSASAITANGSDIRAFNLDEYISNFDGQLHYPNYLNDYSATVDDRNLIVEGTSDGDLIDIHYVGDPDGDRVDALDNGHSGIAADEGDEIQAGDGNDTVYSNAGMDTVYGQGGDDYLDGGGHHDFLDGGDGNDTLIGSSGNDTFAVSDGHDIIADFLTYQTTTPFDGVSGNNDFVDLSGYYNQTNYDAAVAAGAIDPTEISNPLQWLKQDFADGVLDDSYAGWTATSSLRIQVDGANVSINSLRTETTGVVCYAGDALILTAYGPKRADMLQVGDLVHTIDSGFKPIRWIGKRPLNSDYFLENENHRPILIRAHALGPNVPEQDIRVSPQHRILIKSRIVQSVTEVPEVLVPAKALLPMDGVDIDGNCDAVTYVHFLFDEHELVIANGMVSESLYLGKMSIASLGNEAITEIEELFPELEDTSKHSQLCRVTLKYQTANKLAAQHAMNGCHLVTEESFYETAPV